MPITAPYGTWTSPLSARIVAAGGVQLSRVVLDGDDLYWLERRPEEGGRSVVARRSTGSAGSRTSPPREPTCGTRSTNTGAAYAVSPGITDFFEFADQRLDRLEPGGVPESLTGRQVVLRGLHHRPIAPATRLRARGPQEPGRAPLKTLVAASTPRAGSDGDRFGS